MLDYHPRREKKTSINDRGTPYTFTLVVCPSTKERSKQFVQDNDTFIKRKKEGSTISFM